MKQKHFNLIVNWTVVLISIFLVGYVAVKASVASFVHDESLTYNTFVNQSCQNIILLEPVSANNHVFNTILMKLSQFCFGANEFALRLPNVLTFVGFLAFLILILKKSGDRLLALFFFILVVVNPYLLDFFALARGYGLGMCFMVGGLFYMICFISGEKPKNYWLALCLSFLAVWSNFVFLYFYVSLIFILNLIFILEKHSFQQYRKSKLLLDWVRFNGVNFMVTMLLFLLVYEPIRRLVRSRQLYDGGTQGFLHDTVFSLSRGVFYQQGSQSSVVEFINWVIVGFIFIVAFTLFYMLLKKKGNLQVFSDRALFLIGGVFLFVIVEIQLGHFLFGMKYLRNRTGLFLIPLLLLATYFSFVFFIRYFEIKRFLFLVVFTLVALMIFHATYSMNVGSFYEWKYDQNTRKMLSELEKNVSPDQKSRQISLGISWVFEPTINFYRQVDSLTWLRKVDRDGIDREDFRYLYILKNDLRNLELQGDSILVYFPKTNTCLVKINKNNE